MQHFTNIQNELIKLINESTQSLKIAVTWFTNQDLFDAVISKLEIPDFQVNLIVLNDNINNKKEGVDFQKLINKKGNFYFSEVENMVHNKFCIIDDKIVVTGSYNWTYYAENRNWENIVVLDDSNIVQGYIQEFEKIIQNHSKVKYVFAHRKIEAKVEPNQYLQTDYLFQAKKEKEKGNDLAAAKVYTEILKLDNKRDDVITARNEILNKLNGQKLTTCPFEIGQLYDNGYSSIIPAFSKLPITVVKKCNTAVDYATSILVTIQKYDYNHKTILQFSVNNIKKALKDNQEFEDTVTIDENGILTVTSKELNGNGRIGFGRVDLKSLL